MILAGGTSDIAVYFDNSIRHTSTVPIGGKNVTNDIAIGLRTPIEQAEDLKIKYGAALPSMVDADDMISVPGVGSRSTREISQNVLASIIGPRIEEILTMAHREIKKANYPDTLAAGVVITGGGALMPGTAELAEQIFDMPVKIGVPRGFDGLTDVVTSPIHATGVGLVHYAIQHADEIGGKGNTLGILKRIEKWFNKHF